jgi:octanoyl-[GcvH]:protein N-octanoyltransferase
LIRASRNEIPETLRLYRPNSIVAFGRQDQASDGFPKAVLAAKSHGFGTVLRLAGGRAAVFDVDTIAFARAIPDSDPTSRTFARFKETAAILASALGTLGVDARVGAVPLEYCPGDYSVNARGEKKLVGIGQRLISKAAHVGGVIVVGGSERVREVLMDVYEALELTWNPETVGAVSEEEKVSWDRVAEAVVNEFGQRFDIEEVTLDSATLALAETLEHRHVA